MLLNKLSKKKCVRVPAFVQKKTCASISILIFLRQGSGAGRRPGLHTLRRVADRELLVRELEAVHGADRLLPRCPRGSAGEVTIPTLGSRSLVCPAFFGKISQRKKKN